MADMYEWAKRVASSKSAKAPEGAPESMNAPFFDHDWIAKARHIKETRGELDRADLLKSIAEAYASERVAQLQEFTEGALELAAKEKLEIAALREQVEGLRAALTNAEDEIKELRRGGMSFKESYE